MLTTDKNFINSVASISIEKFKTLPKTGKPLPNEWTVLSTIVKESSRKPVLEVVALGTGSKCLGRNSMSPRGDIINDSHAEVICRRAFLRYLYEQLENVMKSKSEIFCKTGADIHLQNDVKFHFFTTQVPCGDAAIFPKTENGEDMEDSVGSCLEGEVNNLKTMRNEETNSDNDVKVKRIKLEDGDIYRTGAKCLTSSYIKDPLLSGNQYHTLGAIRTKPG